jgi:hypothetical protein
MEKDDRRQLWLHSSFEKPAVQTDTVSSSYPNIVRAVRNHPRLTRDVTNRMERYRLLNPAEAKK